MQGELFSPWIVNRTGSPQDVARRERRRDAKRLSRLVWCRFARSPSVFSPSIYLLSLLFVAVVAASFIPPPPPPPPRLFSFLLLSLFSFFSFFSVVFFFLSSSVFYSFFLEGSTISACPSRGYFLRRSVTKGLTFKNVCLMFVIVCPVLYLCLE